MNACELTSFFSSFFENQIKRNHYIPAKAFVNQIGTKVEKHQFFCIWAQCWMRDVYTKISIHHVPRTRTYILLCIQYPFTCAVSASLCVSVRSKWKYCVRSFDTCCVSHVIDSYFGVCFLHFQGINGIIAASWKALA